MLRIYYEIKQTNGITFHVDDKSTRVRSTLPLIRGKCFTCLLVTAIVWMLLRGSILRHYQAYYWWLHESARFMEIENLVSDQTHDMEAVDQSVQQYK